MTHKDSLDNLVRWLREHPEDLDYVVTNLGLPLPKCEGIMHPCDRLAVGPSPSQTQYVWDETSGGQDPNRDLILCAQCAKEHDEEMQERWREYYSGVL